MALSGSSVIKARSALKLPLSLVFLCLYGAVCQTNFWRLHWILFRGLRLKGGWKQKCATLLKNSLKEYMKMTYDLFNFHFAVMHYIQVKIHLGLQL